MKTRKKLLSILLAVLMAAGCFSLFVSAVEAITSVYVLVHIPKAGDTVSDPVLSVSNDLSAEGFKCYVLVYDEPDYIWVEMTEDDTFSAGKQYRFDFSIQKGENVFADDLTLTVNGESIDSFRQTNQSILVKYEFLPIVPGPSGSIAHVSIEGDLPKAGDPIAPLNFTVDHELEAEGYSFFRYDETEQSWEKVTDGTFEAGKTYRVDFYIDAPIDEFAPDLTMSINEEQVAFRQTDEKIFVKYEFTPEGSEPGQTDPQPQTQPENLCKWCGKVHEGFFQKIIGFFHNIFASIFGAKY